MSLYQAYPVSALTKMRTLQHFNDRSKVQLQEVMDYLQQAL